MAKASFGTKAETLERIAGVVSLARVLPQVLLTVDNWMSDRTACLEEVRQKGWFKRPLAVRSSAIGEDSSASSLAGHYQSVLGVVGEENIVSAIDKVVRSYGDRRAGDHVFIQPMLENVAMSGVAFSKDPNTGAPYIVINYDDTKKSTTSITSGRSKEDKTFYCYKHSTVDFPGPLGKVVSLVREIEKIFGMDAIDIEFAVAGDGTVYLLQVRPLAMAAVKQGVDVDAHGKALKDIHGRLQKLGERHPYLCGSRTVYGVMPDWNPAEMIGIRPRPLALSLYKELITDNIWAYQRDNYGYRNLRSFPLLVSLCGLPYIDVRVSFNSFIPRDIDPDLAHKLVNRYIEHLLEMPGCHDKVEFEIVYSCYTFDLPKRLDRLRAKEFSEDECHRLEESLRDLTNRIIHGERGLWRQDTEKVRGLESRIASIMMSDVDCVSKIYWLIEDCKRYGTLPFAGLARAAFIAVQMLKSLISVGIMTHNDYEAFMGNLDAVSSQMSRDLSLLPREDFLKRYGHLRPGTYDILSPSYDEAPDVYFQWPAQKVNAAPVVSPFMLTAAQRNAIGRLLAEHGLDHDVDGFFGFVKAAIEGREFAKYVFSKSVSQILKLFRSLASECGIDAEGCSYADIACIQRLYASSAPVHETIRESVERGRRGYELTRLVSLPPLITSPDDVWRYHVPESEPNFITSKKACGKVVFLGERDCELQGRVLFIDSADPGYDWIFTRGIAGFVTKYGGANSHMAIRAGELGIPAVIGAGESFFSRWAEASVVEIDGANKTVRIIR